MTDGVKVILTGQKLSSPYNTKVYRNVNTDDCFKAVNKGELPYIKKDTTIFSIEDISKEIENFITELDDGMTVSIVIGIDKP